MIAHFPLTHLPLVAALLIGAVAGGLIGAVHFRALRGTVEALAGGGSLARLLALQLGRVVLSAAALALVAAAFGAWALIAAGAGLLVARTAAVRHGAPS